MIMAAVPSLSTPILELHHEPVRRPRWGGEVLFQPGAGSAVADHFARVVRGGQGLLSQVEPDAQRVDARPHVLCVGLVQLNHAPAGAVHNVRMFLRAGYMGEKVR